MKSVQLWAQCIYLIDLHPNFLCENTTQGYHLHSSISTWCPKTKPGSISEEAVPERDQQCEGLFFWYPGSKSLRLEGCRGAPPQMNKVYGTVMCMEMNAHNPHISSVFWVRKQRSGLAESIHKKQWMGEVKARKARLFIIQKLDSTISFGLSICLYKLEYWEASRGRS